MFTVSNFGWLFSFLFCSNLGSDSSTTDYPGKIPSGLDLPSDPANWDKALLHYAHSEFSKWLESLWCPFDNMPFTLI